MKYKQKIFIDEKKRVYKAGTSAFYKDGITIGETEHRTWQLDLLDENHCLKYIYDGKRIKDRDKKDIEKELSVRKKEADKAQRLSEAREKAINELAKKFLKGKKDA